MIIDNPVMQTPDRMNIVMARRRRSCLFLRILIALYSLLSFAPGLADGGFCLHGARSKKRANRIKSSDFRELALRNFVVPAKM